MTEPPITTDYLVIGAGLSGLSFADELVRRSDAHITIADKRDAPGGHWNQAYPFVTLHQPASLYGVESTELTIDETELSGPNKSLTRLATGPEITAYCHAVMRSRLLASGRVRYLPMTEYHCDGSLRGLLSHARTSVVVRRKVVDASYYDNSIPLTHRRSFTVDASTTCIPPNDLPRRAPAFAEFTVLGGGKTGMDACLWLLGHGAPADRIRWVIPRDQWFVNRALVQPSREFFMESFGGFVAARQDIAAAVSARDLAHRHEQSGVWLRLDPDVEPAMFHGAHVSEGEIAELRRIRDVIRQGHVTHLGAQEIVLTHGSVYAHPGTLYVDCTASALQPKPLVPVFADHTIVLQAVRFPQIPFSAALIAYLECLLSDDHQKNEFTAPVPVFRTVEDYIRALTPDLQNRLRAAGNRDVRAWVRDSRLDGFSRMAADVQPAEVRKVDLLRELKKATTAAAANLPRLTASLR